MKKGAIITILLVVLIVAAIVWYSKGSTSQEVVQNEYTSQETQSTVSKEETTNTYTSMTTDSGLEITHLAEGSGAEAKNGDMVTVNYTGTLTNGTTFDSNVDPKFNHVEPFSFMLGAGMVIKGWDEGVLGMKVGEKRHLVIPAELAYGSRSPSPLIPANSVLEFDVEMVAINGAN